jgi:predicted phosphodiesterase
MMWVGLFSDIHANREALEASLDHARGSGISRFIFPGDYGRVRRRPGLCGRYFNARSRTRRGGPGAGCG